jgi:hypothetical protein
MGFIFYQHKQQHSIAIMAFFVEGLMKKSEPIELFYMYVWYYFVASLMDAVLSEPYFVRAGFNC